MKKLTQDPPHLKMPSKNSGKKSVTMHSVHPFRLSRRTFLKGAGAALSLPLLEAMLPGTARAQAAAPRRFFAFYVPNGIHMPAWTPSSSGAGYALTPILAPLAPHQADVLVLSGLDNYAATAQGNGAGDHARGTACFLTCVHPYKTEGSNLSLGPSVDQLIADHLSGQTQLRSLELGCEGGGSTGGCDSGYSCAYTRNISWRTATTPVPKLTNPRSVFDRLFAGFNPGESWESIAKRRRYKQSVLDFVMQDAQRLDARLGGRDRAKLDEYMTSVRELELRLDNATADEGPTCQPFAQPEGTPQDFGEHVRLMLDLVALSFQCDITRVGSFMLGNGGSNRSYSFIGVPGAHHELSHHQGDPAKHAALQTINTWEVEQLAYLLGKLKAADDVTGSVLDNTLVFFSSEVEDGNSHRHYDLPVLLAGGGGGMVTPGRHVSYPGNTPIANLFVSILQGMGVATSTFGDDGTAPLPNLVA